MFWYRICGGTLSIVMIVAIISAKLSEIDSLETLLGFEEAIYFAVFFWLAICGAGKASLDYLLEKKILNRFLHKKISILTSLSPKLISNFLSSVVTIRKIQRILSCTIE